MDAIFFHIFEISGTYLFSCQMLFNQPAIQLLSMIYQIRRHYLWVLSNIIVLPVSIVVFMEIIRRLYFLSISYQKK